MVKPDHPARAVALPRGRQFAVTWSIPDDFGGMTGALLHRSRAFVRLAATPVDILTFDSRPDYPAVERRLREHHELIEGMRLLNLYEWLRGNPVPSDAAGSLDLEKHPFTPLAADPAFVSARRGALELSRTRYASEGTTALQVDHFREDGTLLLSDRRDSRTPGELDGRSIVLCDSSGEPLRSFGGIWALYRFWIDLVRDREPSFMIVDSKTIANPMLTYHRKRAVTIHVVHSSHLSGTVRPLGTLRESRREVFENLEGFDSVVVLTDRQRKDIAELLGPVPNVTVIPNGRDQSGAVAPLERPVDRGIVLAGLTGRKRVGHALRAIAAARMPDNDSLRLDVYGDGEERESLEALRDELQLGDSVRFHGHQPGARAQLAEASFLLLTSTSEGFPLVLVEAMSAGCIPIAYDVPYGPADVIRDGRNGFLVPPGDQAALAEAIAKLQAMSPRRVTKMRRDARRAASEFSDLAVTRTWATAMREAESRKAVEWARSHRAG
jgi:poly(glycerol-phosphate) alpha-glucosyltransferase